MCFYVSIVKSTEGKTSGSPKILISSSNHSLQLLQPGTNMLAFIITPKTVHTWNEEKFNMGGHLHKDLVFCSFPCLPFFFIPETSPWALTLTRGGSRGRVQGVRTPRTWDDLRFSNTTGILQKKLCGLLVLKQSKRRVHPLLKKILDPPLHSSGNWAWNHWPFRGIAYNRYCPVSYRCSAWTVDKNISVLMKLLYIDVSKFWIAWDNPLNYE